MHEQSQTKGSPGNVKNLSGVTGQPLTPLFPYEQETYDTLEEGAHAAERRSDDFGKALDASMERHRQADDMRRPLTTGPHPLNDEMFP